MSVKGASLYLCQSWPFLCQLRPAFSVWACGGRWLQFWMYLCLSLFLYHVCIRGMWWMLVRCFDAPLYCLVLVYRVCSTYTWWMLDMVVCVSLLFTIPVSCLYCAHVTSVTPSPSPCSFMACTRTTFHLPSTDAKCSCNKKCCHKFRWIFFDILVPCRYS
jgi:hypothetical protein